MCGIVGFNYKDKELITVLRDMLTHRGPDQRGIFTDESVSLGHRRLSILDLSEKGAQPMSNEDESVFIVFNGEIFNYKEIREDLIKKGHTFKSKTDTEVLAHLYEEKGYDMLTELNGQFSFCVYDKRKNKLFLARDRTGVLPLFFYYKDNKFIFSSELKCILKSGIRHEIDNRALTLYLRFGYIKAPFCILKNTYKLEAAHYLVFDLTTKTVETRKRYWDLKFEEKKLNPEDLKGDILKKLEDSVKKRLMADVPVGAFLSGGIDSSIVVSMIKKQKTSLKTFSVRFNHKGYDESSFASKVAKTFGTEHYEIDLKDEEIRGIMPRLAEYFDEPFGDPSSLPTYVLAKIAAKHVKVCLSGDGGDEIFAGYTKYKYLKAARVLNSSPGIVKGTLKLFISIILRFISSFEIERVFEIAAAPKLNDAELFERLSEKIRRSDLGRLVNYEPDFINTTFSVKSAGLLNAAQNYDIFNYLDADILTKVDRASMASSLETRPPFLDHELVDICSGIGSGLRLKCFKGKWILREAFKGKIPEYVRRRHKHGFSVPVRHYLDNELKDMVKKYVLDYDGHDLFNKIFLSNIENGTQRVNKNRLYWNIMMFNMWHERWMT